MSFRKTKKKTGILSKLPTPILQKLEGESSTNKYPDITEFLKSKLGNLRQSEVHGEIGKKLFFGRIRRNNRKKITEELSDEILFRKFKPRLLPPKALKFKNVYASHELWKDYIRNFLQINFLKKNGFNGDPADKHWDSTSVKLIKADYHGAYFKVVSSIGPYVGIEGLVVTETQQGFQLLGKDDIIKTVPKKLCEFQFEVDGYMFKFYGKYMATRPSARITKKNKMQMFNAL